MPKSDRRRAWRAALQCFQDGATQCSGAVLFHQLHQLGCLRAGRCALREGQIEKCLALRYGDLQAPTGRGVECLALDFEHRFLMSRIENQLVAVIGAHMASYLDSAIENAHTVSGSGQDQLPADCLRGNGVIVEIETNIDALAGADAFDSVSSAAGQSGTFRSTATTTAEALARGSVGPAPISALPKRTTGNRSGKRSSPSFWKLARSGDTPALLLPQRRHAEIFSCAWCQGHKE
jgi:hypothetical protein